MTTWCVLTWFLLPIAWAIDDYLLERNKRKSKQTRKNE